MNKRRKRRKRKPRLNGLAKRRGLTLSSFNKKELRRGMLVEKEHTSDPYTAKRIAMDHLAEDPNYYRKLAKCAL